jgi:hypothetical protein
MPAVAQANIREQGLAPTNTTHQDLDERPKTTKEPLGSYVVKQFGSDPN